MTEWRHIYISVFHVQINEVKFSQTFVMAYKVKKKKKKKAGSNDVKPLSVHIHIPTEGLD